MPLQHRNSRMLQNSTGDISEENRKEEAGEMKRTRSRSEHETSEWETLLHHTAISENISTWPHHLFQVRTSKSKRWLQKT